MNGSIKENKEIGRLNWWTIRERKARAVPSRVHAGPWRGAVGCPRCYTLLLSHAATIRRVSEERHRAGDGTGCATDGRQQHAGYAQAVH